MRELSRRQWAWSGATISAAVVAALQISRINGLGDQGYFDKYLEFARKAIAGSLDPERVPDFSPGYAWLITLLHGHLGLDVAGIRALQIALLSVAALAVAFAAERAGGAIAALVAGICVAGSRGALLNATDLEPESWILLLGACALVPLMRARESSWAAAGAGLALGLSATLRPSALLLVAALVLWLCFSKALRPALAFVAAAAAPVLVILIVNARITGTLVIMDPGLVFYEGMNPLATGYSGVDPRIVNDLEEGLDDADALHITYRLVAARAMETPLSTNASNHYWTAKALAFAKMYPGSAMELTARKIAAAVSSYDAWDLLTIVRKQRELGPLAVPFGVVIALSVAGLWFGDRSRLAPAAIALLCAMAPMAIFYVTGRQRNAAIPMAAVLAGCAVAAAMRNRRALFSAMAALLAGVLLTIPTHAAAEDRHMWAPATREAMLFDEALRLERAHRWKEAELVLVYLADIGYEPRRRNRATSSISYHLARTKLRQRQPGDLPLLLERARAETAGDPDVLALSAALDPKRRAELEQRLALLHDPFTVELSHVRALLDTDRRVEAHARASALMRRMPEWKRPEDVLRHW